MAKWVEQIIKKGYQDFGNDWDDEPDSPIFPEWPYPEEEYTKEESDEEMAGIRDSRIRRNRKI